MREEEVAHEGEQRRASRAHAPVSPSASSARTAAAGPTGLALPPPRGCPPCSRHRCVGCSAAMAVRPALFSGWLLG